MKNHHALSLFTTRKFGEDWWATTDSCDETRLVLCAAIPETLWPELKGQEEMTLHIATRDYFTKNPKPANAKRLYANSNGYNIFISPVLGQRTWETTSFADSFLNTFLRDKKEFWAWVETPAKVVLRLDDLTLNRDYSNSLIKDNNYVICGEWLGRMNITKKGDYKLEIFNAPVPGGVKFTIKKGCDFYGSSYLVLDIMGEQREINGTNFYGFVIPYLKGLGVGSFWLKITKTS